MMAKEPQIPLEVFRKMIAALPADELAKLPPDKIPNFVPINVIDEAPEHSVSTIESLILKRQHFTLHLRKALKESMGDKAEQAYLLSDHNPLAGAVVELNRRIHHFRHVQSHDIATSSYENTLAIFEVLDKFTGLVEQVRDDYKTIIKATHTLKNTRLGDHDFDAMLRSACGRLGDSARLHCEVLCQYYSDRMTLGRTILKHQLEEVERYTLECESIILQIAHNKDELIGLSLEHKHQQEADIEALHRQLVENEPPITEADFHLWLDFITNFAQVRPMKPGLEDTFQETIETVKQISEKLVNTQQIIQHQLEINLPGTPLELESPILPENIIQQHFANILAQSDELICSLDSDIHDNLRNIELSLLENS